MGHYIQKREHLAEGFKQDRAKAGVDMCKLPVCTRRRRVRTADSESSGDFASGEIKNLIKKGLFAAPVVSAIAFRSQLEFCICIIKYVDRFAFGIVPGS